MQRIGHETYDLYLYLKLCKYVYNIFSLSFLKYHCYEISACFSCPQNPLNELVYVPWFSRISPKLLSLELIHGHSKFLAARSGDCKIE